AVVEAFGGGVEAAGAGGEIVARVDGPGRDAVLVEDDDVGVSAFGEPPAVANAVEARLYVGQQVYGLLEGHELMRAARREQGCRVAERREHVEVCAGVGGADDDAR